MPAYEYLCDACDNHFERRQKMSDPEIAACPDCGGAVRRLISGGAGVIARGGASAAKSTRGARGACMSGEPCPAPEMGCGGMCGCGH
ncbi:MAG: zinc ribbon domain-containing protein [Terracidiphilus sp.]|jgi:putative FmdB family regulatory protein